METQNMNSCAQCGAECQSGDPFCSGCGTLRPTVLFQGSTGVDVWGVPAERHRAEVAKVLKQWFPSIDFLAIERALKKDSTRLIQGIDEDSALRIVEALKALKVVARSSEPRSWASRLLNGGLVVSVLSLLVAPWVNLFLAFLLVLLAVGAPIAGAYLKRDAYTPQVALPRFDVNAEDWARIAKDYARVVTQLAAEDAKALQSIARGVFDLRARLSEESLASAAAGGTAGELSGRLRDLLLSAVAVAERILSGDTTQREAASRELGSLHGLMDETRVWLSQLERGGVREAPQITDEINQIRSRVDAIVHEVRTVAPTIKRDRELG